MSERPEDPLERLAQDPSQFHFLHALRLIESRNANSPPLGKSKTLDQDPIRLGQEPSLTFAPSSLARWSESEGRPPKLTTYALGLLGPNGPMPLHWTEDALEQTESSESSHLQQFLDLFHHRLLSLFYRAWAISQPTVQYDRPESDRFATYIGALAGYGMDSLRDRDAVPDRAKRFFAGHFSSATAHPDGLLAMLRSFFEMPVKIEEFAGHWHHLPEAEQGRISGARTNSVLGQSITLGRRIWDRQLKFRVVLGPMTREQFFRLLPDQSGHRSLSAFVRNYLGEQLLWDARLILKKEEVPRTRIGSSARIGLTTWMRKHELSQDATDVRIKPHMPMA